MSTTASAPVTILRTATGREALRWVYDHCRATPLLPIATVLATVAGAVLQVVPVFLLGTVVDGVQQGRAVLLLQPRPPPPQQHHRCPKACKRCGQIRGDTVWYDTSRNGCSMCICCEFHWRFDVSSTNIKSNTFRDSLL